MIPSWSGWRNDVESLRIPNGKVNLLEFMVMYQQHTLLTVYIAIFSKSRMMSTYSSHDYKIEDS
jgi:hypothetical protein